jgi:hypothetical protein
MFVAAPLSTDVVLSQPAPEFCGSAKFISRSPVQGPDPDIFGYLAVQIRPANQQPNAAEAVIAAIGNLEGDWDGYGAVPISAGVCANASRFLLSSPPDLSSPEITPTSNGTMNLEWTSNDAEAYLEIGETRYTGHIQVKTGDTIYLDGSMTEPNNNQSSGGIEQALALISGLLHGTPKASSIAKSL